VADGAVEGIEGFESAWHFAAAPVWRSLEQAYRSLLSEGLAVGSVLTDAGGRVAAEGRNRAYDAPGGADALQGTPLAHAEMNALAVARREWDLREFTLWSTQEPCAMCAAAAAFTGVGRVRFLAPDPWALAAGHQAGSPEGGDGDEWLITANVLFLQSIADSAGPEHPTLVGNREHEPETAGLVRVDEPPRPAQEGGLAEWLRPRWADIAEAAVARRARRSS
jgi:tRNA(Arg) A34 adenosine deaminase TadA